ncbi:MAG: type ISP restriction/modification enzyme [Nitrosomonas sp.]|nr:type ISP restriction/modification enzyme [Nitrosomonas sp.]MDP1952052.1 type ISP restriction/modification enzyme [Nitrosomonas sp.]
MVPQDLTPFLMRHFKNSENIGLCFNRKIEQQRGFTDVFVSSSFFSLHSLSIKESNSIAPLYHYPEAAQQQGIEENNKRIPNLKPEIIGQIAAGLGLRFVDEKEENTSTFAPIDLLDYIYAALHSPTYRETYKEFLKIDFPRIPYPKDSDIFWQLVQLGGQLRQTHLLESSTVEEYITSYPKEGDNVVTRKIIKKDWELYDTDNQLGRIWINEAQYFDQIPLIAWEFYIGGYQPAQKWLKDRTGRKLSYEDILHYQKIIKALAETNRLMQEIDTINIV